MSDFERRFEELRQFNKILDESRDKNLMYMTTATKNVLNKKLQNWLQIKYMIN